jgi:EpsI family protein
VSVFIATYANPQQGRELVSVGNVIVPQGWRTSGRSSEATPLLPDGRHLELNEVDTTKGQRATLAWYWFAVNGRSARSQSEEKLLEARAALSLQPVVSQVYVMHATGPYSQVDAMRRHLGDVAAVTWKGER